MPPLRRALILLAVLAGAPAATATAHASVDAPPDWTPDVRAARDYADLRSGEISFSVRTPEREWERRPRMSVNTASVIKAMLLVAYLDQPDVRRRPLNEADRALLSPMVRYSDNATAQRVFDIVGNDRINRLARRAKMRDFRISPAWGLSQTTAADQARWFLRLPEIAHERHRDYALTLLRTIVPEQRWGVGRVVPRGWRLYFKGGWGSGSGAVSHQVALLRRDSQRVALAIMTTGSPDHAYSQETLRGVALRLVRGLADVPRRARPEPVARPRPISSPWPGDVLWTPTAGDAGAAPMLLPRSGGSPSPADRDPFTPMAATPG